MNGLIRASLRNPYAVTVMCLTLVMLGTVAAYMIRSISCRSSRARPSRS